MEIPLEIPLWAQDVPGFDPAIGQPAPGLTPCLVEGARGAVIVLPGGGYAMRADHEGLPVAEMLNRAGISAFVLSYRVAPYRDPVPLLDVRRALRLVRHHRAQLGIERVGVLGFSAGGHLAGCAALLEDGWAGDPQSADPVERESARPDAAVLCYPVVTGLEHAHRGSFENLLGGRADDPNELRRLSLELRVGPPCAAVLPVAHRGRRLRARGEQPDARRGPAPQRHALRAAHLSAWPSRSGPGARRSAGRSLAGRMRALPARRRLLTHHVSRGDAHALSI